MFSKKAIVSATFLCLGLMLPLSRVCYGAGATGSISITEVDNAGDQITFSFVSTWPRGTSYQPQFLRALDGEWHDLPDAKIEEVAVGIGTGTFRVTAPRFGGESGFYRALNSASTSSDPIQNTLDEPEPDELVLLWNQPESNRNVRGKVYYHVQSTPGGPVGNTFRAYPTFDFGSNWQVEDSGAQDSLVADLDGDGRADPLFVWANRSNHLTMAITRIVSTNFSGETTVILNLDQYTVRPENVVPPIIRVLKANTGAGKTRLFLAYTGADGFVHIRLLELSADLQTIQEVSSVTDTALPLEPGLRERSSRFDIAAGDFDGDGRDEVALLYPEAATIPNGIENWSLNVRFYNIDPVSWQFARDAIPAQDKVFYTHNDRTTRFLGRVAGHAADFDGDGRDELAIGYHVAYVDAPSRWFVSFARTDSTLASLQKTSTNGQIDQTSGSNGYPLGLLAGDFNGDSLPELVYGARSISILTVQTNLAFTQLAGNSLGTEAASDDRRFMTLANLDASDPNTGSRPEIVFVRDSLLSGNSQRQLQVISMKVTGDASTFFRVDEDATLADELSGNAYRSFALGATDLGGNGPKLGTPRRYTRTVSGKPIVVLNAPPLHFDVFNGASYDVNDQFPVSDCPRDAGTGALLCGFFSRYSAGTANKVTVETQWERGWDFSAKIEGGFEIPIVDIGVEVAVQTKYGERLDTYTSSNQTTVIELQVDAVADDRVYAATVTYSIWEYPVLVNGETVGHLVVVDPQVTRQNWFGSKSVIAENYRPYHEGGNLLSYRSTTTPYPGASHVRELVVDDTFTVDSSSSFVWRLTRANNTTTTASRTFNFDIDATASFDIPFPWVPDVELSGGYDSSRLESSTTSISDEQGMASFLGALDGAIAGTAYSVTPYLYWDRSGALVLDYAVDLPLGSPSVPTFWRQRYGQKSDPTFILPWRLDPEKGLALQQESQRQLTREITTVPPEPRPGQAVDLIARISNFSVMNTPSSFRVRFYLSDPTTGATPLISRDGFDYVLAPAGIPAGGKQLVHFPWRIPENATEVSLKIYAVIDVDNQIDEIHEDNNMGWNEIYVRNTP